MLSLYIYLSACISYFVVYFGTHLKELILTLFLMHHTRVTSGVFCLSADSAAVDGDDAQPERYA